jgi:hypothetical protein
VSLTDAISSLSNGTFTVTRAGAFTYDANGRLVPGALSTFPITAVCLPVSGRDLMRLPDGARTKELRAFYTTAQLLTANAINGTAADVVEVPGVGFFQLETVADRSFDGFYRAVGALIEEWSPVPPDGAVSTGDVQVAGSATVSGNKNGG